MDFCRWQPIDLGSEEEIETVSQSFADVWLLGKKPARSCGKREGKVICPILDEGSHGHGKLIYRKKQWKLFFNQMNDAEIPSEFLGRLQSIGKIY